MAPPALAVATGEPWCLLGWGAVWGLLRFVSSGRPPPEGAVRALEAGGLHVGFDTPDIRCVQHEGRRLRVHTPAPARAVDSFVVAVPHAIPFPDHTWVALDGDSLQSRHAPTDLRTRVVDRLRREGPVPAARIVLDGEAVQFWLPTATATTLPGKLDALVAWTEALEDCVVVELVEALQAAGLHHLALEAGGAGSMVFRGQHPSGPVTVHFGRFHHRQPTWRGRPELRVTSRGIEHVFIGPCTRTVADDVRAALSQT